MYIKVTTGGTGTLPVITGTGTGTMPGGTTGTGSTGTMSPTGGNGTACERNKILIMLNDKTCVTSRLSTSQCIGPRLVNEGAHGANRTNT